MDERSSAATTALPGPSTAATRSPRVLILDFKWSYGIEEITSLLCAELRKRCDVAVVSAEESTLPDTVRLAPSRAYREMALAFVNPAVYFRLWRVLRRVRPEIVYLISPHVLNASVVLLLRIFTRAYVISHVHDPE